MRAKGSAVPRECPQILPESDMRREPVRLAPMALEASKAVETIKTIEKAMGRGRLTRLTINGQRAPINGQRAPRLDEVLGGYGGEGF